MSKSSKSKTPLLTQENAASGQFAPFFQYVKDSMPNAHPLTRTRYILQVMCQVWMYCFSYLPLLAALVMLLGQNTQAQEDTGTSQPTQHQTPAVKCQLPEGPLPTETRVVIVLDTSGSMRGIGDGKANIFDQVKNRLADYVTKIRPNQLHVVTFDQGVRNTYDYQFPSDLEQWQNDLSELKADGNNTYLYRSLQSALEPLAGSERFLTSVFVLTDGIDNDPKSGITAHTALEAFAKRGPLDTLAYVALGTKIPKEAREAIEQSNYASGWTFKVGEIPNLLTLNAATSRINVTDPNAIPIPFDNNTPLSLSSPVKGLKLASPYAQDGFAQLKIASNTPYGSAGLLCAPPNTKLNSDTKDQNSPEIIGPRLRRVLLSLQVGSHTNRGGLIWLNPRADRELDVGEEVVLRYRSSNDLTIDTLNSSVSVPKASGLTTKIEHIAGSRYWTVRIYNKGGGVFSQSTTPSPSQVVIPRLTPSQGRHLNLPAITVKQGLPLTAVAGASGPAPELPAPNDTTTEEAPTPDTSITEPLEDATDTPAPNSDQPPLTEDSPTTTQTQWTLNPKEWPPLILYTLGGLLTLLLLAALFVWRSRWLGFFRGWSKSIHSLSHNASSAASRLGKLGRIPSTEGLEYREDRTLVLMTDAGATNSIATPLGGPFDIGRLARVPLLSGLRAEQHRDGLLLLNIPVDIEVSQGTRLLHAGDIVRPNSLLGVAVAPMARAPHGPMGQLVGLGLPLKLKTDGVTLNVIGPYGQHAVTLNRGITDLGEAFISPALNGLKVSTSGPRIMLAELPKGMAILLNETTTPLRPGTYLPNESELSLPER